MPATVTKEQLRREVERLTKDHEPLHGQAIGFRTAGGWSGGDSLSVGETAYRVRRIRSTLELREDLLDADATGQPVVMLADLSTGQLAADVLARLHRGKLHEIEPWTVLAQAFRARQYDGKLRGLESVALALLAQEPTEGFAPVSTGFLDIETVWRAVARHVLSLGSDVPTPRELLGASLNTEAVASIRRSEADVLDAFCSWLEGESQRTSARMLRFLVDGRVEDAVPIGLACQVIFNPEGDSHVQLRQAEVRLESVIGGAINKDIGKEWGEAAVKCLAELTQEARTRACHRADELLGELQAAEFSYLSDWLPTGYDQRLRDLAEKIEAVIGGQGDASTAMLLALRSVLNHRGRATDDPRGQKAAMAVRLARWLNTEMPQPSKLSEAVRTYVNHLAFVDWARDTLSGGDPLPEVQRVYRQLSESALTAREDFNKRFAELTIPAARKSSGGKDLVLVEGLLQRVLAPITATQRVLLLVMDGMSWSVAHELLTDMESAHNWVVVAGKKKGLCQAPFVPLLSTVPSITSYARHSLLTGQLSQGSGAEEKSGFAGHPSIKEVCSVQNPARLFHRGEIEQPGRHGISEEVQKSIANAQNQLVGVVVNAVDDHLLKSDQEWHNWRVNQITVLESLLAEARNAKRLVLMVADHGHLLDRYTDLRAGGEGGARWRKADKPCEEGESMVSGPRVTPFAKKIVVPWSEKIRYAKKLNGYHGGISPQELVAPCCVLSHGDHDANVWTEIRRPVPAWWSLEVSPEIQGLIAAPSTEQDAAAAAEFPLFATVDEEQEEGTRWIDDLFKSELYRAQRKHAGARAPANDKVRTALKTLNVAGGQVPNTILAARLNMPDLRVRGMVEQLKRLLNVEGYPIIGLTVDEGHVQLNRELLVRQFELEAEE